MKYNKVLRILVIAMVLSLLAVVIPATPALAAREIELDPEEGEIGEEITITGTGFTASTETSERWARIFFAKDKADTGDDIDDEVNTYEIVKSMQVGFVGDSDEGEFETTFTVPAELTDGTDDEDVEHGTYYVYVTLYNTSRIKAYAEFTVVGGEITIDPDEGPVGTAVEISGEDFDDREDISIEYDGDDITDDIVDGEAETDRDGEFECTIIIPESTAGDHTITVIGDDSGNEVEAVFTVEPEITISPESGGAGTPVTVSGTGFDRRSDFTIYLDNTEVATETTDRDGGFDITFNVPILGPGTYDVEVWDEDDNSDEAEFTIGATASLSPTTGNIGTELTVSGIGFIASRTVTITYDTAQVATATTDVNGTFSVTFTVPESKYGGHPITATDGTTTEQFTFTMESTPPPIPTPLLPEMDTKAEAEAYFDWEDVTDPSGVTYTLQIASSSDFTSLVLEKKGLTESEYTLTKAESLQSTEREAPYYWRVKAVDGASNESEGISTGSFYVGFALELPQWALYALIGIDAFIFFILGFWMGRRTTYYTY